MAAETRCALCELAIGRQQITRCFAARELAFCCMGCANVYSILFESGVIASGQNIRDTEVFRRSLEMGLISNAAADSESQQLLDENAPTQEMLIQVGGMWCSACGWLIEHALCKLQGVASAEVFFASDLAKVKFYPQLLPPDEIPARITQLGYRAAECSGDEAAGRGDLHSLIVRLGVAAFLWANIMAFSVILYVGYFEQIAQSASRALPYILLALSTAMVFYCAFPILRSAAIGLRNLQIRMEVLLSMGILTAYFFSVSQTVRGQTHLYFDTAAAIVTLVLAGKLIERAAKERAARAIAMMYRVMPKKARLVVDGAERFVSIDALEPNTIFFVKAGERIPADGVILEGATELDESLLSGESAPIRKCAGDTVVSGSLNIGGAFTVRALRTTEESTLVQIIRLVERALAKRAPIEHTVDLISRVFVPSVIALSIVVFGALVIFDGGQGAALMRAISILVIACPCALGLATPLALTFALGQASQNGILISDSRALESMGKIDCVVLDKTGTVTQGNFRVIDSMVFDRPGHTGKNFLADYLPVLAGIELASEHLLGRAVVQHAHEHNIRPADVTDIEVRKGEGITALHEGQRIFIGNLQLATLMGWHSSADICSVAEEWQKAGRTVAFFGCSDVVLGLISFGDRIKPGAVEMIQYLRKRGIITKLVSGDAIPTTASVAAQVGVDDYYGEVSPQGKSALVKELQSKGLCVAVIGDGVNDAPALATAEIGIALGTGAEIAMSAAPVVLVSGALDKVEEAFRLGARATRIIRQNLFWAFFYNTAGIALAISGVLNPIMAAGAMFLSSTSVVANSMRLSRSHHSKAEEPAVVVSNQLGFRSHSG